HGAAGWAAPLGGRASAIRLSPPGRAVGARGLAGESHAVIARDTQGSQEVAMEQYVGLDVSQKETAVCVIDGAGTRLWEGTCRSTPEAIVGILKHRAPTVTRVAMETGPLAVWHWHALKQLGVPVVYLHARQAKAALTLQANKTDRNDAHGLAQIVRAGWYRAVEMKSLDSHELRALLHARQRLVGMRTTLYNQVRGLLKTFGVILPSGRGSRFPALVEA